jgi:hypothetical protein
LPEEIQPTGPLNGEDLLEGERAAPDGRCDCFVNGDLRDERRECLLIAQDQALVECYTPSVDGRWMLAVYEDLTATVSLPSTGCQLALAEAYDRIDFAVVA